MDCRLDAFLRSNRFYFHLMGGDRGVGFMLGLNDLRDGVNVCGGVFLGI